MKRGQVLDKAKACVCEDRDVQYGPPENSFAVIAGFWSEYLSDRGTFDLTASDVAIMMALFKISRMITGHNKADNYVDAAGYIACAGEIAENEDELCTP